MKGLLRDTVLYANTQGMLRKGERRQGATMDEEISCRDHGAAHDGHDPFRFFKPISLQVFAFCGEPAILPGMPSGCHSYSRLRLALQSPLDTIKMFIKQMKTRIVALQQATIRVLR
jgi:hypothetical protein